MKKVIISAMALLLILSLVPLHNVSASPKFERIAGTNRLETAIEVSKRGWPDGLDNEDQSVILARADNPADALSAASLAGVKDAPILLTETEEIDSIVLKEINRLGAKKVYVLGGTGAISAQVTATLETEDLEVQRINGSSRFETAAAINDFAGTSKNTTAIVANGYTTADALTASGLAAVKGVPIYLSRKDSLPESLPDTIEKVYIYGGTGVVSKDVEESLKEKGIHVHRTAGKNRYETNFTALRSQDFQPDHLIVVRGTSTSKTKEDYPDAVVASGLAHRFNAKVVLVHPTIVEEEPQSYLEDFDLDVFVLGGIGAVSNGVVSEYQQFAGTNPGQGLASEPYSSNQVNMTDYPMNDSASKVEGLYGQTLGLQVIPTPDNNFMVFEGDFLQAYDDEYQTFIMNNDFTYDDIAIQAMKKLGLELSETEIQKGMNKVRGPLNEYSIDNTTFYNQPDYYSQSTQIFVEFDSTVSPYGKTLSELKNTVDFSR
ncbi:cell wall-binding repeat-containing protein [Halobacillus salinarum]|uniref:Cell wall-binding repeat-containing protein n=1 Tax=Halobacillus salinarum TaxID=2932257 RepID=A0ABY4EM55_9BACI|nr:cell wall-binding repeat-containing protein [Halobacillus salinarum]UOQ45533.1 cell wall-binding repeat-containing protein [Halobacillus salinarum]